MKLNFKEWALVAQLLEEKIESVKSDMDWHIQYSEKTDTYDPEQDSDYLAKKARYEALSAILKRLNDTTL